MAEISDLSREKPLPIKDQVRQSGRHERDIVLALRMVSGAPSHSGNSVAPEALLLAPIMMPAGLMERRIKPLLGAAHLGKAGGW